MRWFLIAVGAAISGLGFNMVGMSISLAGPTVIQGAGGSFSVPVVSLKEKRWTHVVRQQYDFSCGSAAVATLLTYHYETPIDEAVVFEEMFVRGDQSKIRTEGFSMLDIKQFLDRRGLNSDGIRMSLDKLAEIGVPAIVLINTGGYRHFVVIKGIEADRILVADSAFGTTIWPRDRFEAAWGGGIILAAREGIDVAQEHFGDIPDWQIRPKAPIGQGVDRSGLATFTLTLPGRHEFGR
jgi:predicted double-glycine peptidase